MECEEFLRLRIPDDLQQGPEGELYVNAALQVAQMPHWSAITARAIAHKLPQHLRGTFMRSAEGHYRAWSVVRMRDQN